MTDKWTTRQSLLLRAKDPDDHQAWEEFVKYYKQFIHMILNHMSFRTAEFEDMEQEVLLKIWKNLPNFELDKERANFRTWLSWLIRNSVIDYIRKARQYETRQNAATEHHLQESDVISQPDLDKIVEREWVRYLTQTALNNIRNLFSGAAVRSFELSLAGKTSREIGAELDINHESVRTLKNRVKVRLVKEIERLRKELEF